MKKIIFVIIIMACSFTLTSCKMKSLVGKTFVFDSFSIEGENLDDLDQSKVKELEKNYKTIVFNFEETTVKYNYTSRGETYNEEYNYTFIDGKLEIEDNTRVTYYIKSNKLYVEGPLDSFKLRLIFKQK